MAVIAKKEDLRVQKTRKALYAALFSLLNRQTFAKITVHDICAESMVSKTAFYAHFKDKYDLLGRWLKERRETILLSLIDASDRQAEEVLYEALQIYLPVLGNLIDDAGVEQQILLYRFFSPSNENDEPAAADFIAGGLFYAVYRQVKENRKTAEEDVRKKIGMMYRLVVANLNWES
ncbi:MAG: TetR/AcrR family transcriptional regulator [Oscillospiraceae bacterium]|nr:TetR/AcrR family transcriptional regulator [Oscillospiraceae bacterium]